MTVNRQDCVPAVAGADLSSYKYCFVKVSAEGTGLNMPTVVLAGVADGVHSATIYVLQNAPESGETAQCLPLGSNTKLRVGGVLAFNASIMVGADGEGVALAGATKYTVARALEASTADQDEIEVETLRPSPLGT